MANNFPPTVTILGETVELGDTIALSQLFSVSDIDPNSVTTAFRFSDRGLANQTGRFSVNGTFVQQGLVIELPWDQLHTVRYHAGSVIGSELISVEVFDGLFWSDPGVGPVFSVTPNDDIPIAEGTNFSVVALETVSVAPFVSASDPDGYPILEYLFVDRSADIFGSSLIFKGQVMAPGVWFPVQADELDQLSYRGAQYGKSEIISFIARDEAAWSAIEDITATTLPNLNDPVVQAIETVVTLGQVIPVTEMFIFSDADNNTMKSIGFREQGTATDSGYFAVNGVRQTAGQWFWVSAGNVDTVTYVSGSTISLEQFEVQVSDGQRLSRIGVADVSTVDVPSIQSGGLMMIDSLEQVLLSSHFNITSGIAPLFYDVIDMNTAPTSAKIIVNGNALTPGEVHRISAIDFASTFVEGGLDDLGRSFDEINVRVDNGIATSAWSGVSFSTDPVNQAALLDIGQWNKTGPVLNLTYNFPLTRPEYYCTLGFPECTDFDPMLDPGMRGAVRQILDDFELYFNVRYTEVPSTELSDVSFALSDSAPGAGAYAYSPGNPGEPGIFEPGGDIFGTTSQLPALQMSNPGEFGYFTMIHENGHSLGLDHPFALPADQAGEPPHLPVSIDTNQFSVMSYTAAYSDPNTGNTLYPATPMLYDFMALQTLYGANPTFRAGNTQIKFDKDQTLPQIVYDSGGTDTFNLNNHTISATINLNEGQFSTITGIPNNVGIAWGTSVENGRGGSGNDTIIGNPNNNVLIGNAGDDILRGGGGVDYLHGNQGRDIYDYFIGDGNDVIDERFGAGRDVLQVNLFNNYIFDDNGNDPLGGTTLVDNFQFLRDGNNLEVRLTLDSPADNGTLTITDMGWGRQRVESLRIIDFDGNQIGPDVSLLSIFEFATGTPTAFEITNNTSNYGNLATPV